LQWAHPLDWSVCLLALKHLVSLQARVRPSVQAELDLHTADTLALNSCPLAGVRSSQLFRRYFGVAIFSSTWSTGWRWGCTIRKETEMTQVCQMTSLLFQQPCSLWGPAREIQACIAEPWWIGACL
jgi:hypothetical protein